MHGGAGFSLRSGCVAAVTRIQTRVSRFPNALRHCYFVRTPTTVVHIGPSAVSHVSPASGFAGLNNL